MGNSGRAAKRMARARSRKVAGEPAKSETAPASAPSAAGVVAGNVSKGDIVWIDFEGWTLSPNGTRTLFDTTRQEGAKKENRVDEKKGYAEFPIIVGHGRILPGLDEALP